MDIRSAQKMAWQNKVAKGFNTIDVPLEFCLLRVRSPKHRSLAQRLRRRRHELADVAIYLLGLLGR